MLWLLLRGALGRLGEADQVVSFSFTRLTVRSPRSFAARRMKVATDGEISWLALPLVFCVAPERLLLIRPSAQAVEPASP